MSLIEIQNAYKYFYLGNNQICALNNINLTVNKGDFVSIIGTSGSGKSTLMNIIGCLDTLSKGSYFLNSKNIDTLTEKELSSFRRKQIGFVFQSFNLIPTLTASENVELPLIYGGFSKKIRQNLVENALGQVGLSHRQRHKPSELSGGQQQRVAIARALACSPPIILADEPTGNLDSKSASDVMEIFKQLHNQGKTIILITHDNNIAKSASRIFAISDGKIQ